MSVSRAEYLWAHMAGLYGHRWASAYGEDPKGIGGREWSLTLEDLSREQIDTGLQACRTSGDEWPPNASLFRAMCLAIPSLEAVRAELQGGDPSPFTRAVWAKLDVYRFRHVSSDQADKMVGAAYELVRERVMRGESLPNAPVAEIAHEKHDYKPASKEVRERNCAEIRALLGMGAA